MLHSLRFRFALICIGLAVGPLIIAGSVIGVRGFNTFERQSLALHQKIAENAGTEIRATIKEWENELVLLDEVYRLGILEPKEQRAILSNTLLHCRAFQEVVLLDSEGQEQIRLSRTSVILDDELQSRAGNEEFLFAATSGENYFGPVYFDDTIREPLATISVPLFDRSSGEIVSVLVAELRFKTIWGLLADIELTGEGVVYIIDQAGHVIAHRNPAIVLRDSTIELPEVDGRAEGLSGTDVIVARDVLQFGNQELVVVAEQPISEALEPITNNLAIVVTAICVALAFAVILALFTIRRIVRPIEALATSAQAIGDGDFSQRVEVSSRDEVGQLAGSFNKMAEDLARTTTSIDNLNKEITERKLAEQRIDHLNEVLYAIRNVNQLIARENNRDRLLKGACDNLVETRGYCNAWIALLDESGKLVTHAEAGLGKDFQPMIERLKHGKLTHCGQQALEQSEAMVIQDPPSTCADCPLVNNYRGRGAMTVRLEYGGKVYGILSASIPAEYVADNEEQALFKEIASDIAFALHNIKGEEERKRVEEKLHKTLSDMERFNRLAVGREQQMIELKREVNDLLRSIGRQEKYRIPTSGDVKNK